ncbi:MAG: hypothetical protein ACRDYX_20475 [Egibacteraceae bacterium]
MYLGLRLDLYAALRDGGPATPAGLAARAGIDERYAREWLEQQAVDRPRRGLDRGGQAQRERGRRRRPGPLQAAGRG